MAHSEVEFYRKINSRVVQFRVMNMIWTIKFDDEAGLKVLSRRKLDARTIDKSALWVPDLIYKEVMNEARKIFLLNRRATTKPPICQKRLF